VVVETGASGTDTIKTSLDWVLTTTQENLVLLGSAVIGTGNASGNVITGDGVANILDAGAGNDTVYGGGGNDSLIGGLGVSYLDGGGGDDTLVGGDLGDTYVVDSVGDVIVEGNTGTGTDTVISSVTWTLGTTLENLTLTGAAIIGTGNNLNNLLIGNDQGNSLAGNSGNDTVYGGAGNDSLLGGAGDDSLNGGIGNDTMYGGDGSDVYVVDSLSDIIGESGLSGTDTVVSGVTWTLATTLEALTLSGLGLTNGTGNANGNAILGNGAANVLSGLGGNDTLSGDSGNDSLNGGAGADSLTGGGGADQFVYKLTSDSNSAFRDTVVDFSHAQVDKFDLTGIDAKSDGTLNDAFSFITTGFTGHTGELRVTATTGGMLIEGDTNGDKTADLVIFVAGASAIVAGDFLL
jgi:Ca2+-binding RTX toxin-like protein